MRLVVVGNGIAGVTAARHVRKLDAAASVTLVSDETLHPYARTALMYVYMGHLALGHTHLYEERFWRVNRIERVHDRVEEVDAAAKRLRLRSGATLDYDRLLLATGSRPARGGWPGEDLAGVQGLYGLTDLEAMERDTRGVRRAAVVGGGLIGIELAEMLRARGIAVTHLVREPHYYADVLPEPEGRLVEAEARRHGVDLRLGEEVAAFEGEGGRVHTVRLRSGGTVPAAWVGVGIGVVPNVAFLAGSGVEVDRGVLVDEHFRTNVPDVFAAGDCAQLRCPPAGRRPIEPLWYVARLQGATVAFTICDRPRPYDPGVWINAAKFFTLEWQQVGYVPAAPEPGLASLYREVRGRAVRIAYREPGGEVVGLHAMGVRLRQEVCAAWVRAGMPVDEVVASFRQAVFDPEFARPVTDLRPV